MAIVTFHDVNKMFGTECVFDGLSLPFLEKEAVGMVGPNGAGKSTILKLILGEIQPDVGQVVISKGVRIAYLPQEASFATQAASSRHRDPSAPRQAAFRRLQEPFSWHQEACPLPKEASSEQR